MIPIKYQKNKFYFQYRIDALPDAESRPRIIIGVCTKEFDPDREVSRQENVWCMNLFSGDIYATKKWKSYYTIEPNEIKHKGATFGLFEEASIIGMLVDRDRGFINFFKDGNDMG